MAKKLGGTAGQSTSYSGKRQPTKPRAEGKKGGKTSVLASRPNRGRTYTIHWEEPKNRRSRLENEGGLRGNTGGGSNSKGDFHRKHYQRWGEGEEAVNTRVLRGLGTRRPRQTQSPSKNQRTGRNRMSVQGTKKGLKKAPLKATGRGGLPRRRGRSHGGLCPNRDPKGSKGEKRMGQARPATRTSQIPEKKRVLQQLHYKNSSRGESHLEGVTSWLRHTSAQKALACRSG